MSEIDIKEYFLFGYIMKKLSEPIYESQAYQLGLINENGDLIKKPNTEIEKSALTPIDNYILKLKKLLGSKIDLLNSSIALESYNKSFNTPIEHYDKELALKSELSFIIKRFNDTIKEASKTLKTETLTRIIIESF